MYLLTGICILLAIACLVLIIYIISLKRGMRSVRDELKETRQHSYNRQLTVTLFDKDLTDMASEMNRNLDYQKMLKQKTEQLELQTKQSVSDIAHDLRTPLTVVKGNLQMLEREEALSERGQEYLAISMTKTDSLKQMIDDFFELSVLESDSSVVNLTEINATNLLMQFLLENEAVIRNAHLNPVIQFPEHTVFLYADEMFLKRMLSNLLSNILKYGKETFEVRLEVLANEKKCRISFANAVTAAEEFDVLHIFERSYQGDKSRHGSGAGLGLYIVKLLADKQKASVSAGMEGNQLVLSMEFDGRED